MTGIDGTQTMDGLPQPAVRLSPEGQVTGGIGVESLVVGSGFVALAGWTIGAAATERPIDIRGATTRQDLAVGTLRLAQHEAAVVSGVDLSGTATFLAVLRLPPVGDAGHVELACAVHGGAEVRISLNVARDPSPAAAIDGFLAQHIPQIGFLTSHLIADPTFAWALVGRLPGMPGDAAFATGFIEQAKALPGLGGMVIGWAIAMPGAKLLLVDEAGQVNRVEQAVRWQREDIVQAFETSFGGATANAGMVIGWHHPVPFGSRVRLIAIEGHAAALISEAKWTAAPLDPVSFARWSLEIPTPVERLPQRFAEHDGPLIEKLMQRKISHRSTIPPETFEFGPQLTAPECSIIVPLYGRYDFLLDQLLEFADDQDLVGTAEIVYVVDDQRILTGLLQEAPHLYEANRVPFKVVWGRENRGYSGANNLGASISRAPTILLLNSDVIPIAPGWLRRMLDTLRSNPKIGIVGARLLYPNGAIQHDGMAFRFEPALGAYVNIHPGMGLQPQKGGPEVVEVPATTGACLLLRRETWDTVGGMDENFLIGDFEDSDLCLRVRAQGLGTVVVRNVSIVHLERQSFSLIGVDRFRDIVVRYNAHRHQRRWGSSIAALTSRQAATAKAARKIA